MQGDGKIILEDYSSISSRVSIYSSNDDYTGEYMTNPTLPKSYLGVVSKEVIIRKHVIIGSGSIILPGVEIKQGAAIGALSLVNKNCEEFWIYNGNPAKKLIRRSKNLLKLEAHFIESKD